MSTGIFTLPWWGYALVALAMTHVTIAAVTIFLHRHQAHRAVKLSPLPSHFFRFWLWLTTGMVTREWAAIHRKHHAKCETPEDPHSPQTRGIRKVLWQGAELYRAESLNPETLEKYGHGTPDDWIERKLYSRHSGKGIVLMLGIDLVLFGPIGLTIWAVQMIWIPLFAAGVINGVGHYWGYRNFASEDASRNVLPWGILIGGEELHNNHHAYASSARLSSKWYEFDIGWFYIRTLETLGMARVRRVAPRLRLVAPKPRCDGETLKAVLTHRHEVMAKFARALKATYLAEIRKLKRQAPLKWQALRAVKPWVARDTLKLEGPQLSMLTAALNENAALRTVYSLRQDLAALWERSSANQEVLLKNLEDWCLRAESSGVKALEEFSRRLRRYAM